MLCPLVQLRCNGVAWWSPYPTAGSKMPYAGGPSRALWFVLLLFVVQVSSRTKQHRHIQARLELNAKNHDRAKTSNPPVWGPRVSSHVMDEWRETTMRENPIQGTCAELLEQVCADHTTMHCHSSPTAAVQVLADITQSHTTLVGSAVQTGALQRSSGLAPPRPRYFSECIASNDGLREFPRGRQAGALAPQGKLSCERSCPTRRRRSCSASLCG